MCILHSVLPNDYTLRHYAGKVATFCSICLCKWEACLTPASWLWDIISHNSLTAWLACGAAGFKWRSRTALEVAAHMKACGPFCGIVLVGTACPARGNGQPPSNKNCQNTSKGASQLLSWKESLWLLSSFKIHRAGLKQRPCSFK